MHTLFGTGYTHGASRVSATSIFTNNIHVSVRNSSVKCTWLLVNMYFLMDVLIFNTFVSFITG